jgi:hypothetical protein
MSGPGNDPARQFAAAWEAASDAVGEWAQRVAEATNDALDKLDPAVRSALEAGRAVLEAGRATLAGQFRECHCLCGQAHPDDMGVCDHRAVITRRLGNADVPLCAPCAAAQGFAEMAH